MLRAHGAQRRGEAGQGRGGKGIGGGPVGSGQRGAAHQACTFSLEACLARMNRGTHGQGTAQYSTALRQARSLSPWGAHSPATRCALQMREPRRPRQPAMHAGRAVPGFIHACLSCMDVPCPDVQDVPCRTCHAGRAVPGFIHPCMQDVPCPERAASPCPPTAAPPPQRAPCCCCMRPHPRGGRRHTR